LGRNVCFVDASATADEDIVYAYIVNRSEEEEVDCTISLKGFTPISAEHRYIAGEDVNDKNTFDEPNKVRILGNKDVRVSGCKIRLRLLPHSVNIVRINANRVRSLFPPIYIARLF